jgi:hypothetical protein
MRTSEYDNPCNELNNIFSGLVLLLPLPGDSMMGVMGDEVDHHHVVSVVAVGATVMIVALLAVALLLGMTVAMVILLARRTAATEMIDAVGIGPEALRIVRCETVMTYPLRRKMVLMVMAEVSTLSFALYNQTHTDLVESPIAAHDELDVAE